MKNIVNKILLVLPVGLMLASCSPTWKSMTPDHLNVTPSLEAEIKKGEDITYKPKIQAGLNWNFKSDPA